MVSGELNHRVTFPAVGHYCLYILLGDRGIYVWTTCQKLFPERDMARSQTRDLWATSLTDMLLIAQPGHTTQEINGRTEMKMDLYLYHAVCALCSVLSVNDAFADVEGIYLLTSGVPDQPTEICNSYLEEASAGHNIKLHITLFSIDETDNVMKNGTSDEPEVMPCRYASMSQTARSLRDMAHSTAGGRFHWVRETGKLLSVCVFSFCRFKKW